MAWAIGFSTALITPKISATTTSVRILCVVLCACNWMPGTRSVATQTAAAVITSLTRIFMPPSCHRTRQGQWLIHGENPLDSPHPDQSESVQRCLRLPGLGPGVMTRSAPGDQACHVGTSACGGESGHITAGPQRAAGKRGTLRRQRRLTADDQPAGRGNANGGSGDAICLAAA